MGEGGEGDLQIGYLRPSPFPQMLRQHIILGLNFRAYTTIKGVESEKAAYRELHLNS